jgi:hypothetical protein
MIKKRSRQQHNLEEERDKQNSNTSSRCLSLPIQEHNVYTTNISYPPPTPIQGCHLRTTPDVDPAVTLLPPTPTTITPRCSRSSFQRFGSKQRKIWKETIQRQISMEKQCHKEELLSITSTTATRI